MNKKERKDLADALHAFHEFRREIAGSLSSEAHEELAERIDKLLLYVCTPKPTRKPY